MNYKKPILLLALSLSLTACGSEVANINNQNTEITETKAGEQRIIYTSFYPIYNLTKQIAGDKFDVKSFTNLKTESHGWEPSAKDMKELANASIMFLNGAGMEEWAEDIDKALDITQVSTSDNLDLIEASEDDHDHDYAEDEHVNDHGDHDPHTWLSPINGKDQAKVIADKLSEIDPANKDYYISNYQKLSNELDGIVKEYKEKFDELDNRNFIVTHKAFSYLARDFDLNQIALTGIMSTDEANPDALKEAIEIARELGIYTIFYEMGGSDKQAKILAEEIGGNTQALNTLEFATDDELSNETTYQELMRLNLEALYQSMSK